MMEGVYRYMGKGEELEECKRVSGEL